MDVHPPKNGIFIAIDPYPYERIEIYLKIAMGDEKVEKCGAGYGYRQKASQKGKWPRL
jgi:hypothetical protein